MNYRHLYHAGNFSDIFKHSVLLLLLQALHKKDTPFCYYETHAGIGIYPLDSDEAQKTLEYKQGLHQILKYAQSNPPESISLLINIVNKINSETVIKTYPGSPYYAKALLREHDRMLLAELHPQDYNTLKKNFSYDKQVAIHHMDGYQMLKAFLPPKEKRGLVLIDPPFEKPDDFNLVKNSLNLAFKRWPHGIYSVWYPVKNAAKISDFYHELKYIGFKKILQLEIFYSNNNPNKLQRCGLAILNPPYQIETSIIETMEWLCKALTNQQHFDYLFKEV